MAVKRQEVWGPERGRGGRKECGRCGSAGSSSPHSSPVPKYHPSSHVPTARKSRVNKVHPGRTAQIWLWFFPSFHHIVKLIPKLGQGTQLAGSGSLRKRGCLWGSPVFSSQLFHNTCVLYWLQEMQEVVNDHYQNISIQFIYSLVQLVYSLAYRSDHYGQFRSTLFQLGQLAVMGLEDIEGTKQRTEASMGQKGSKNNLSTKQLTDMLLRLRCYNHDPNTFYSSSYFIALNWITKERDGTLIVPL